MNLKQLDMELFGGCNYKCKMCPQSYETGREKSFKKALKWANFTKIVDEAVDLGVQTITLHGGGEPTLHKDFIKSIKYIRNKKVKCLAFSNGYNLNERMCGEIADSDLSMLRVSIIGYDKKSYFEWMKKDAFYRVRSNVKKLIKKCINTETRIFSSHLITDLDKLVFQKNQYIENWINVTNIDAEIWQMHNWSGNYENRSKRFNKVKRTCGRPLSSRLEVRAGGLGKKQGAVVACCMVLGNDSQATLGHLDNQSIIEVLNDKPYKDLVLAHKENRFDDIPYCKNCDQLYEAPQSLVWTNIKNRKYQQSLGDI